ncbi:MAG: flippase-like domain-containing protein, partial [Bacteroidales bacterium]|nr:flippase-like domain-containing protein [Bacteroidales bacterium]
IAGAAFLFAYIGLIPKSLSILILAVGIIIFFLSALLMKSRAALRFTQKILNSLPFMNLDLEFSFQHISNSAHISVIVLSLISNFSAFISCYMLAIGLNFELSFLFVSGGIAIAGLLNMLPVTVMGLGTREGTFLLLFKPMAEPLILAFSGLVFLVAQIGGGLISLILGQLFLFTAKKNGKKK